MRNNDLAGTLAALQNIDLSLLEEYQITTYQKFLDKIYDELDFAIREMCRNPELEGAKLSLEDSEDRTTIDLIRTLKTAFRKQTAFHVEHETKVGGHADMVIKHGQFMWIGEAKIFKSSYKWLRKGVFQLVTRYSTGDELNQEGALLIYIKKGSTKSIMRRWKDRLMDWSDRSVMSCICSFEFCERHKRAFYTYMKHPRSGETFKVRHIPVSLQFDPQDNKKTK